MTIEDTTARAGSGMAVLRGIGAVVAGLGLGELLAGLIPPHASPAAAVAGFLVDVAPSWAKETAIAWFGTWDKAAVVVGIAIVLIGLGAVAGLLERWRPPAGTVLVATIGVIGLVAVLGRGGGVIELLPGLLGAAAAITAFVLLGRLEPVTAAPETSDGRGDSPGPGEPPQGAQSVQPAPPSESGEVDGTTRRAFLAWAGGLTLAGALAAVSGATMSGLLRARSAVASAFRLPTPLVALPPVPASAELGVPGLSPVVTPNADFYRIDTAFIVPSIAPEDWRLRIHGMVDEPFEIGWTELTALDFEELDITLLCVSNEVGGPYIGNARWLGTRLRPLIERARPRADADMALSMSADGWTASTPLEALRDPDRAAILAVSMNDEPLAPEHGAPVRMVVPGLYGYVSATKWVVDIELTRFDQRTAYWTDRGWAPRGPVKLQSRIDVPSVGRDVPAGPTSIAGVAWYQHVGVAGVEVCIDDGEWRPAELASSLGIDTWVQWRLAWDAEPGVHQIAVRAIGTNGEVQTAEHAGVLPDGATGHHTIAIRVD